VTFFGPAKILKNSVPNAPLVGVSGCAVAVLKGTGYPVDAGIPGAEKSAGEVEAMIVRDIDRVGMFLVLGKPGEYLGRTRHQIGPDLI
jgi:hypothetical protein